MPSRLSSSRKARALMSNILDCPATPEALQLDMPLEVTFEELTDDITLPQFKPAGDA